MQTMRAQQETIAKAAAEFLDVVRHCITGAFGAEGSSDSMGSTDVELARRMVGHVTVRL